MNVGMGVTMSLLAAAAGDVELGHDSEDRPGNARTILRAGISWLLPRQMSRRAGWHRHPDTDPNLR